MQLSIKAISPEHAPYINQLSTQFGYELTIEQTAERIRTMLQHPDHIGFVALAENKVVGWIHAFYTLRLESDTFIEIGGMVVDEPYRRNGIGHQMIEKIKGWGQEKGVAKIRVRCHTARLDTHIFYNAIGFVETKEQKVMDLMLG